MERVQDLSNAIAYYRVSTQKQAEEYSSREAYRHWFKQFGFQDHQIYDDIGSGGDNTRPGYLAVLNKIKHGTKMVYVPDLLRFTRSVEGWEEALKDFQLAGATIQTLDGYSMEFDTPEKVFVSRQLVVYGAYEREKNKYRALKGHEYLRSQGKLIKPRFPYLKDPDTGKPIPNTTVYEDANQQGHTVWEVASWMIEEFLRVESVYRLQESILNRYGSKGTGYWWNEPPRNDCALRGWLTSSIIRGHMEYFVRRKKSNQELLKHEMEAPILLGNHPALIDEDTYQTIRKILGTPKVRNKVRVRNPLIGLVFCGACHSKMIVKASRSQSRTPGVRHPIHFYLRCEKSFKHQQNREVTCDRTGSYGIEVEDAEDAVIDSLINRAEVIAQQAGLEIKPALENPRIVELRRQINTYEGLAKDDPDLIPIINSKRAELEVEIRNLSNAGESVTLMNKIATYAQDPDFWQEALPEERMSLYRDFVDRVTIDLGFISVKLKV